jgi:hypothetical protein
MFKCGLKITLLSKKKYYYDFLPLAGLVTIKMYVENL